MPERIHFIGYIGAGQSPTHSVMATHCHPSVCKQEIKREAFRLKLWLFSFCQWQSLILVLYKHANVFCYIYYRPWNRCIYIWYIHLIYLKSENVNKVEQYIFGSFWNSILLHWSSLVFGARVIHHFAVVAVWGPQWAVKWLTLPEGTWLDCGWLHWWQILWNKRNLS